MSMVRAKHLSPFEHRLVDHLEGLFQAGAQQQRDAIRLGDPVTIGNHAYHVHAIGGAGLQDRETVTLRRNDDGVHWKVSMEHYLDYLNADAIPATVNRMTNDT